MTKLKKMNSMEKVNHLFDFAVNSIKNLDQLLSYKSLKFIFPRNDRKKPNK